MRKLEVYSEVSQEVLDVITLSGSQISYENGKAKELFEIKKGIYQTNKKTFDAIVGSSNGYTTFRVAD